MRNPSLLSFMAAILEHSETGTTLGRAARLDPLDLQHAVATAEDLGFAVATGEIQPSLRITADGWAWISKELSPFRGLMVNAKFAGGAS